MVLGVTDGRVAVTRNLVVALGDRSGNLVGVKVATSLGVDQTDDITVSREAKLLISLVWDLVAVGVKEPVIVGILVVVASNLLLGRALRVRLDVRMEQTSSVAHVLQRRAGAVCDLKGAVLANFGTAQVGLEE